MARPSFATAGISLTTNSRSCDGDAVFDQPRGQAANRVAGLTALYAGHPDDPDTSARGSFDDVDARLIDAARTPFGRFRGGLSGIRVDNLAALPVTELLQRHAGRLDPTTIDDVMLGNTNGVDEDNRNIGHGLVAAALPVTTALVSVTSAAGVLFTAVFYGDHERRMPKPDQLESASGRYRRGIRATRSAGTCKIALQKSLLRWCQTTQPSRQVVNNHSSQPN